MVNILVVEDDLKLNQIVCMHLNDKRIIATPLLMLHKS